LNYKLLKETKKKGDMKGVKYTSRE